jgi:hypothetical protein
MFTAEDAELTQKRRAQSFLSFSAQTLSAPDTLSGVCGGEVN